MVDDEPRREDAGKARIAARIAALGGPEEEARYEARSDLVLAAEEAPETLDAIAAALEGDPSALVRRGAAWDRTILAWALHFLARQGERAAGAAPAVERLARSEDRELAERARAALRAIQAAPAAEGGAPAGGSP